MKYIQNNLIDKNKRKFIDKRFLTLNFEDNLYVPKVYLVKRNERALVHRYHLLRYFGLVESGDFSEKNLSHYYYSSKKNMLTYASKLEFQLSSLLLRSGFIENLYVADHLSKRKLFLVNGTPSLLGTQTLNIWDIVSPDRNTIW